jgi:hypothetical protein
VKREVNGEWRKTRMHQLQHDLRTNEVRAGLLALSVYPETSLADQEGYFDDRPVALRPTLSDSLPFRVLPRYRRDVKNLDRSQGLRDQRVHRRAGPLRAPACPVFCLCDPF